MVREIENTAGIPVVHIATIVPIMLTVGSNRIVPGIAIPHPLGLIGSSEEDHEARRALLEKALAAISADIEEQKVF